MLIVIPVRLASTRLPQKAIADIAGLPMMIHVGNRAKEAGVGEVVFACGDKELCDVATSYNFKSVLTDPALPSGTDRVHAACVSLGYEGDVINLQGDMPFINSDVIRDVANRKIESSYDIVTAVKFINDVTEAKKDSVVKAIMTSNKQALYFTRAACVPHGDGGYYKHLGIYAYNTKVLSKFVSLPPAELEIRERLEQLRALDAGMNIEAIFTNDDPVSIDMPADLELVRASIA